MSGGDENPTGPKSQGTFEFGRSTRRTFLSRLGLASLLATTGSAVTSFAERAMKSKQELSTELKDFVPVTLRVNGNNYDLRIDSRPHCSIACANICI